MMVNTIISLWVGNTFQTVLLWGACCQGEPNVTFGLDDDYSYKDDYEDSVDNGNGHIEA